MQKGSKSNQIWTKTGCLTIESMLPIKPRRWLRAVCNGTTKGFLWLDLNSNPERGSAPNLFLRWKDCLVLFLWNKIHIPSKNTFFFSYASLLGNLAFARNAPLMAMALGVFQLARKIKFKMNEPERTKHTLETKNVQEPISKLENLISGEFFYKISFDFPFLCSYKNDQKTFPKHFTEFRMFPTIEEEKRFFNVAQHAQFPRVGGALGSENLSKDMWYVWPNSPKFRTSSVFAFWFKTIIRTTNLFYIYSVQQVLTIAFLNFKVNNCNVSFVNHKEKKNLVGLMFHMSMIAAGSTTLWLYLHFSNTNWKGIADTHMSCTSLTID